MDTAYFIVYCTCPHREVGERIAAALVNEKIAACVNILPGITSIYHWEEKIQRDSEVLLIIKTRRERYAALEQAICHLHPYETPEIVALPVVQGSAAYLAWIDANAGGRA